MRTFTLACALLLFAVLARAADWQIAVTLPDGRELQPVALTARTPLRFDDWSCRFDFTAGTDVATLRCIGPGGARTSVTLACAPDFPQARMQQTTLELYPVDGKATRVAFACVAR